MVVEICPHPTRQNGWKGPTTTSTVPHYLSFVWNRSTQEPKFRGQKVIHWNTEPRSTHSELKEEHFTPVYRRISTPHLINLVNHLWMTLGWCTVQDTMWDPFTVSKKNFRVSDLIIYYIYVNNSTLSWVIYNHENEKTGDIDSTLLYK